MTKIEKSFTFPLLLGPKFRLLHSPPFLVPATQLSTTLHLGKSHSKATTVGQTLNQELHIRKHIFVSLSPKYPFRDIFPKPPRSPFQTYPRTSFDLLQKT